MCEGELLTGIQYVKVNNSILLFSTIQKLE